MTLNNDSAEHSGVSTTSVLDPFHPLYLHPSDTPGTVLVYVPFAGIGFGDWKEGMLISLSTKNKVQLIDGSIIQLTTYYPLYPHCLQQFISSISQGSYDIATYYTKLKGYWDEIYTISLGRPCTCGAMHEFSEAPKLIQFLSGLNKIYSIVKSNILMMSLVPSVEKAYSILIRDEKQREINSGSYLFSSDSTSFIAYSNSNSGPNQPNTTRNFTQRVNFEPMKTTLSCKYCKKPGHTVGKCYKIHGFPQDFKFNKGKRSVACVQIDLTD
ncbi:uncharacterized protein [Nicotiana sylvestris]|uniref:uncharacterized protein n=1 Tax=Nicotiana sylvestris TaxID=4096 RepID=UPI00388CA4EB